MPAFDLDAYVTVDERIDRFWAEHPEGRILTDVAWVATDGSSVAVLASVYADRADDKPAATGLAQEERGGGRGPVNSSSWWENCETSAIGRALANLGMSLSKHRPSREEMQKAERYESATQARQDGTRATNTPRAGSAGPGREAPAPRRSAPPTDRPAAVPGAAGPPSRDGDGHPIDATSFWRFAKAHGVHSADDYRERTGREWAEGSFAEKLEAVRVATEPIGANA